MAPSSMPSLPIVDSEHQVVNHNGQGRLSSISVFGLGYVGSVTAACLAHKGHKVLGVDLNPAKVEMLDSGCSPILEPSLDELVKENN